MSVSIHAMAAGTFGPILRSLSALLDKAVAHAHEKGVDPAALPHAQLAPDMFPLVMQVRIACEHVAATAEKLGGREAPKPLRMEKTIGELKALIARVLEFFESVPASAFAGAESRAVAIDIPGAGITFDMTGEQFLRDWALPNFYFHVVTAYDILRHQGVQIGKRDYLSHVGQYIRQSK